LKPTISVIIPALDEETNIAAAVEEVTKVLGDRVADYELLLFDDGSRDRTGEIMDKLARANSRIRVAHNARPRNLGGVYKQGIAAARFDYILMVPGDNENPGHALIPVLDKVGNADIVIPYATNTNTRPLIRRIGSAAYTKLVNLLFGHRLKFYNGTVISRTADLRVITIRTNSFAYQSEALVKLLHAGKSYVEVAIEIQARPGHRSKALRFQNLINVLTALGNLMLDIHFRKQRKTSIN
jgi:glycosyltransferase involved in cell wall biosynthesis